MFNVTTYYANSIINTKYNDCSTTIYNLKRGDQDRQGVQFQQLVAVLVLGGPILGRGGKFGMTEQLETWTPGTPNVQPSVIPGHDNEDIWPQGYRTITPYIATGIKEMQLNTGLTTTSHTLHCIQVDTPWSA